MKRFKLLCKAVDKSGRVLEEVISDKVAFNSFFAFTELESELKRKYSDFDKMVDCQKIDQSSFADMFGFEI